MKHIPFLEPELSRPLQVDKISAGGMAEHIVASDSERKALAARFGLLGLSNFEAHLDIDHARGKMIAVTGSLKADVVQQCVVSLEPLTAHIEDNIDILFAPSRMLDVGANPIHTDEVEVEAPEPIINGFIDLGELVSQHLAMALDPYPRKAGLKPVEVEIGDANKSENIHNPFAKLAVLKEKLHK